MSSIYLGIDIGTTSAKCLAVDETGKVLAIAQRPYPLAHPHEGWAEQDPEDYWRGIVETVRRCAAECECKGEIVAAAMSTQGDTLIVTDEAGKPLAPALSWMDTRGEAECREMAAEMGQEFWYRETGFILTNYNSACNIRWLERNDPDLKKRIRRYCWVADYLAGRLCGRFVSDVPSASWTPLYSPVRRSWSEPVMDVLGISREMLPDAAESGTTIGELLPEVASELGLKPGVKLMAGAFDQAAAAHGAGAGAGRRSVLSCGTAWVLYAVWGSPVVDDLRQIPVCCHVRPDEWGMVLPFTGGAAYDWLQRTFQGEAGGEPSGAEPPVFIPHLYGGLCPDWRGESKGSILGLTLAHNREDVRRALMRGMAFEARRNVEAAERISGKIGSIRMVGGAGKSDIWPQMIASILDRPVEVSENVESACYGAAKLAAGGASANWDETQTTRDFAPIPAEVEAEQRRYEKYLRVYETVAGVYREGIEDCR